MTHRKIFFFGASKKRFLNTGTMYLLVVEWTDSPVPTSSNNAHRTEAERKLDFVVCVSFRSSLCPLYYYGRLNISYTPSRLENIYLGSCSHSCGISNGGTSKIRNFGSPNRFLGIFNLSTLLERVIIDISIVFSVVWGPPVCTFRTWISDVPLSKKRITPNGNAELAFHVI
jgi:hypothetical protein